MKLWAKDLESDILLTLVNGSVQGCQPNTHYSIALEDERVIRLIESASPFGEDVNPELVLLNIRNNKLNIYTHGAYTKYKLNSK